MHYHACSCGTATYCRWPQGDDRAQGEHKLASEPIYAASSICELPRIYLPRTGVKIVSAVALFHSFGVARQGPWVTWVNKGKGGEGRVPPYRDHPSPTALPQAGCLLEIEGFAPNYRSEQPYSVRLPPPCRFGLEPLEQVLLQH